MVCAALYRYCNCVILDLGSLQNAEIALDSAKVAKLYHRVSGMEEVQNVCNLPLLCHHIPIWIVDPDVVTVESDSLHLRPSTFGYKKYPTISCLPWNIRRCQYG